MAASIEMRNSYLLVAPLGMMLLGCGGDAVGPASGSTASMAYWALRLNQHAITLSVAPPHNTIQLHAIPRTAVGTAIPSAASVKYTILSDGAVADTSIAVSASGLVTARTPSYYLDSPNQYTFPVSEVVASLTIDGVTLADTALVRVTATAPAASLRRISVQPPADSLALYQSGHWLVQDDSKPLNLAQLDVNGDTVRNDLIYVRSSDPNIGFGYGNGCEHPIRGLCVRGVKSQADVTFYVQFWYYGVDVSDSLRVRVGYRHTGGLAAYQTTPLESRDVQLYWWPATVQVTAPAVITFTNYSDTIPLDAIFDHPENVHIRQEANYEFYKFYHVILPVSAEGNVTPFHADTVGTDVACAQARFNGTTLSADSTCLWKRVYNGGSDRARAFTTPGTYSYHTRFGNEGKIIVH